MDVVLEAERLLAQFNNDDLCRNCLHLRVNHLHGLMACCVLTVRWLTHDERGTTFSQELCECESLR